MLAAKIFILFSETKPGSGSLARKLLSETMTGASCSVHQRGTYHVRRRRPASDRVAQELRQVAVGRGGHQHAEHRQRVGEESNLHISWVRTMEGGGGVGDKLRHPTQLEGEQRRVPRSSSDAAKEGGVECGRARLLQTRRDAKTKCEREAWGGRPINDTPRAGRDLKNTYVGAFAKPAPDRDASSKSSTTSPPPQAGLQRKAPVTHPQNERIATDHHHTAA